MKTEKIEFVFALAVALTMGVCAKDATDGLVGWWRVEQKPNGTVFQPADLRDHAHVGTTSLAVNHATDHETYPCYPVCHTNVDLVYPMGSGLLANEPCLLIPQPTNTSVSTGNAIANNQNVVLPVGNVDFSGCSGTFIIRFNPASRLYAGRANPTVFSYDWSQSTGIKVVLRGQGSIRSAYVDVYFGKDLVFTPEGVTVLAGDDIWYDVGVVVEPNLPEEGKTRVTVHFCKGDGLANMSAGGNKVLSVTKVVDSLVVFGEMAKRRLRIGSTAGSGNWGGLNANETLSSLLVHQMKVYDRALSSAEFEQACAPYFDPLFVIGSKNGSSDEFSDDTTEEVYEPFSMPWRKLRKTLTAENPSLSIKTSLTADDKDVSRILEFTPFYSDDCPSDAKIEVLLNGTKVAEVPRNAETDRLVHLNGKTIGRLVTLTDGAYPLTLTLKRAGGMGGSIAFDRISLGGGWQLGVKDAGYGEFMNWEPLKDITYNFFRYFLARGDIKLLSGQMYGKATSQRQSKFTLCFSVSDAMAKKGAFLFRTRPIGSGTVDYYLNGEFLFSTNVSRLVDYEIDFENGMLRGGVNELAAEWFTESKDSTGFDYMRLEPKRFPRGTTCIIR